MKQFTKKLPLTCFALAGLTMLTSTHAMADTVLGGYVGIQGWNMGAEGGFSESTSSVTFNFEEEGNTSFYAALEHPIPLVPNIKLVRTTLNTSGTSVIESQFDFGDEVFLENTTISNEVDLTTIDYILYYEILDNDLVSIDIGISGKQLDGELFVADANGHSAQQDVDVIIPMGYAKIQVGLPFTGLSINGEGSMLAIGDDSFSDYQIALSYSFVETLALDMSIQAGYRSTEIDLNDVEDIYVDLQFDGAYIGIEFDF
jgi:outer membrane protein